MKIAITGKGGVGKTTIAGTMARLMGRSGYRVIAVDADPNTNLAYTLGLPESEISRIKPLAVNRELLRERMEVYPGSLEQGFFKLYPKVDDIIDLYGIKCPDNVTLLVMGTVRDGGTGCLCPAHALMRALLRHLILKTNEVVILDMEAGIEHLARGTAREIDLMIAVVEPNMKAIDTAKRIKKLAMDIDVKKVVVVANKIASQEDEDYVKQALTRVGLKLIEVIPYDENVKLADMKRASLIEFAPKSPAVEAVERLKDKIIKKTI